MTIPAETAASADAVRFEHVGLILGENRILDDVCAHVPRGKFTAIVGPNGAGKTTLTLAILGQIRNTGKVLFPDLTKPDGSRGSDSCRNASCSTATSR